MGELGLFVGALVAVYLVPGPDMVLILQIGAVSGRGSAFATAAGFALARATHVALAAFGLAALLTTSPMIFEVVRYAGTAYLVWLGIQILRASSLVPDTPTAGSGPETALLPAFYRGLLTNTSNPKALLFCSVLLPQFTHAEQDNLAGQFLLLGTVLVITGWLFDVVYATVGMTLGRWIARSSRVQKIQRWLFATMLIGFGIRLVFSPRPA